MSIISENKKAKATTASAYREARAARDEAERKREAALESHREIKTVTANAERDYFRNLTAMNTDKGMTAREIAKVTEGGLTVHEVVGNLQAMAKGKSRQHIGSETVKIKGSRHQVRKFVEVDENGEVVENGRVIRRSHRVDLYHFNHPTATTAPTASKGSVGGAMVRAMIQAMENNK